MKKKITSTEENEYQCEAIIYKTIYLVQTFGLDMLHSVPALYDIHQSLHVYVFLFILVEMVTIFIQSYLVFLHK